MMSPDRKWVWNGQQWLPVAVRESVFPAYGEATAAAASEPVPMARASPPFPPVAAVPLVSAPPVAGPAMTPPISYTAQGSTPPWMPQIGGGRSSYMYGAAAFIVVVIGVVLAVALTQSWLPFLRASLNGDSTSPAPVATPTPQLAVRSEFAVAARYIDSVLKPSTDNLSAPFAAYGESCVGLLSASCRDAVTTTDAELKKSIAALTAAHPPVCISRQVAKVLADMTVMEAAVQGELKAFQDNNRNALVRAMSQEKAGNKPYPADLQAVSRAQATSCDGQQEGP